MTILRIKKLCLYFGERKYAKSLFDNSVKRKPQHVLLAALKAKLPTKTLVNRVCKEEFRRAN